MHSLEFLENQFLIFFADSQSGILHRKLQFYGDGISRRLFLPILRAHICILLIKRELFLFHRQAFKGYRQRNCSRIGILDCIIQEIHKYLSYTENISKKDCRCIFIHNYGETQILPLRPKAASITEFMQ